MNPSSLHALIIDRHFGELSPEVSDLLAVHLAQNPAAQAEADRILQTLATTEQAVVHHPELARVGPATESARPEATPVRRQWVRPTWLARAAVFALLMGVTAAGGFFMGRSSGTSATSSTSTHVVAAAQAPRQDSPWASYQLTSDAGSGGLRVVRIDTLALKKPSLR